MNKKAACIFFLAFFLGSLIFFPAQVFAAPEEGYSYEVKVENGADTGGMLIHWNTYPQGGWSLYISFSGQTIKYKSYDTGFLNEYVYLPQGITGATIASDSKLSISTAELLPYGELPLQVQKWQPPAEKADILIFSAHPDDELVFFGGTIPYYGGQLNKNVQVVYMTNPSTTRTRELLDGLWHCGIDNYPVLGNFRDKRTDSAQEALYYWDEDNVTAFIVEQIRRFKPSVIITHDLDGEYGHGQHMLTARIVTEALSLSADETEYEQSYLKYGVWDTPKCYLHLYDRNKIHMDWKQALDFFGGKTAYEIACEAYNMHVSQVTAWDFEVYISGRYSSCEYGLYRSLVGEDVSKNDFLENIAAQTPEPSPTQEPPVTPADTLPPTPQNTEEPVISPSVRPDFLLAFAISATMIAAFIFMYVYILKRKVRADRRKKLLDEAKNQTPNSEKTDV